MDDFFVGCFAHGLRPILCEKQVTQNMPVIVVLNLRKVMRNIPILLAIMFLVACASAPKIPPPQPKPDAPHFWTYKDPNHPPLVKVAPVYPKILMSQGKEGWVLVEYALNSEGEVITPTAVDSSPKSEFDKAALTAITKWRYTPKVARALNASTNPKLQRLFTF